MDLLTLTAAHERRLGALVVNVGPEVLLEREWRCLSLLDCGINLGLSFLLGGGSCGLFFDSRVLERSDGRGLLNLRRVLFNLGGNIGF